MDFTIYNFHVETCAKKTSWLCVVSCRVKIMADEFEPYDDPTLKGLSRYFNNRTIKGRANVRSLYCSLCFSQYCQVLR
jgi:hypothetical protein